MASPTGPTADASPANLLIATSDQASCDGQTRTIQLTAGAEDAVGHKRSLPARLHYTLYRQEMSPAQKVLDLARAACIKLDETFNAPDVLPYASEALEIVLSHPERRSEFEETFIGMTKVAPPEFVEVCMHALRWSTVKLSFEKRHREAVDQNDWRTEPYYRPCLDAFEDDWDDAKDLYAAFFRNLEGPR